MTKEDGTAVKWICIMFSVMSIAIASVCVASKLTSKFNLTDPIAQRIWAATHGRSYSVEGITDLVRASTLVDTAAIKQKD